MKALIQTDVNCWAIVEIIKVIKRQTDETDTEFNKRASEQYLIEYLNDKQKV